METKSLYKYKKITTNYDWVYSGEVFKCSRCNKYHRAINIRTSHDRGNMWAVGLLDC